MTSSPIEQKIRAQLPFTRMMQAYVPLSFSNWLINQGLARVQLSAEIVRQSETINGVACEWLIPQGAPRERVLLYFHGGGFVYGLTPVHLVMVAHLAQKIGIPALMVDYRLAPKHPYPAALDDCITAYRWLLKQGTPSQNIVMAGDSAGGNLTLTTLMKLRDQHEPLPAAAACLSPVANFKDRNASFKPIDEPLLHPKAVIMFKRSYLGSHDPGNPYISPVFGHFEGLPPLLIHAGENEILREDAVRVETLARDAGVDVRLEIYPRMWHVWQLFLSLPQAAQSLDDISRFFKAHLGHGTFGAAPEISTVT